MGGISVWVGVNEPDGFTLTVNTKTLQSFFPFLSLCEPWTSTASTPTTQSGQHCCPYSVLRGRSPLKRQVIGRLQAGGVAGGRVARSRLRRRSRPVGTQRETLVNTRVQTSYVAHSAFIASQVRWSQRCG